LVLLKARFWVAGPWCGRGFWRLICSKRRPEVFRAARLGLARAENYREANFVKSDLIQWGEGLERWPEFGGLGKEVLDFQAKPQAVAANLVKSQRGIA
jgi:hypothetical protein